MLHILITILKILGILLLVLVGILLFIVLSILFVPVCYRAQGHKREDDLYGKAAVSWLFRLIYVRVIYSEGKTAFEVYLFGIPLFALMNKLKERKKRKSIKSKAAKNKKSFSQSKNDRSVKKSDSDKQITKSNTIKNDTAEKTDANGHDIKKDDAKKTSDPVSDRLSSIWNKAKNLLTGILNFPGKVVARIQKIRLTFRGICDKIKQWYTFLQMDDTKQAVHFLTGKGRLLIRHIMPRKITGRILFGFDDPALTGKALAAASLLCPLYKNRFQITPVFDRTVFEGEVKLRGRIFGGYLLLQALQIYRNREVKATYQRFQQKEA
ncbi:MAG: DUF2953 domain-containing protein [Oliverpabstia sp.]